MTHWKIQSHLQLDKGLFYFFPDLPLPSERWVAYSGGNGDFSESEERLKSDEMQMPQEHWSLSSPLAGTCLAFPSV